MQRRSPDVILAFTGISSFQLADNRFPLNKQVKWRDVKQANSVIGVIHRSDLLIDLHPVCVLGSPLHIVNAFFPGVLFPVFLLVRDVEVDPDQLVRKEFDVRASSADDNSGIASRHTQAGAGLESGVVIAFNGYPEAVLIIGGHGLGFHDLSVGMMPVLSHLLPLRKYQFGRSISKNE